MRLLESAALTELARSLLELGEVEQAATYAERALERARERGQRLAEGRALLVLGLVRDRMSNPTTARAHWASALEICQAIGTPEAAELRALRDD